MKFIVNTLPHAADNLNGIPFAKKNGVMVSTIALAAAELVHFQNIPGIEFLAASAPEPLALTGAIGEHGEINVNFPMPDGSSINVQATGTADPAPVVTIIQAGGEGSAEGAGEKPQGEAEQKPAEGEAPADDVAKAAAKSGPKAAKKA